MEASNRVHSDTKFLALGYILKAWLVRLADGLDIGDEKDKSRMAPSFSLRSRIIVVAIN